MTQGKITRLGTTKRWSDATSFNGIAYFCEVPDNVESDIAGQSRRVLELLEASLLKAGSSKSLLLSCTIYIPSRADVSAFNEVWDAWLPEGCAPVRACIIAGLVDPALKVEVQATAALSAFRP